MKLFSSKRRAVTAAVVILLALFLLRPGVSQLKARIANSLSRAVARPVEVGSVHLRLLPPGFDLENLVIHEDPAFGAEPMLRAPEVTAVVRLTSLLRGRLDIARLELSEPSLNLLRRPDGVWNLEALLERAARTPLAPTAKSSSEPRPGFPYIEATSGRINFKAGAEKKPYALLNADFALWQESENAWGGRLSAQPLRTDMNLSDTGVLRMQGIWQRAGSLRETPLQFSALWDGAQLGQLTKLLSGTDKGWRGGVRLAAALSGTPAALKVAADVSIEDFRRYDISSSEALRLAAHCDGSYRSAESLMREIVCAAPVGDGLVSLRGIAGLPGVHKIDVALNLDDVPVNGVAELARRAKKNLPSDLISSGSVQGDFFVTEKPASAGGPEFHGRGEISKLRLQSTSTKVEFSAGNVPFVLSSAHGGPLGSWIGARRGKSNHPLGGAVVSIPIPSPNPEDLRVEFGPFPVALGRPSPAQARGWVRRSGYGIAIRGDGEVSHTLRLASLLGLPVVKASVEGVAQMDLQITGAWAQNVSPTASGFALPEVTGNVQLHNLRATVRGVNGPLEISAAELRLSPDGVRIEKLAARAANARWTGSLSLPRGCGMPGSCLVHFNLSTDEVGLSGLHEWLAAPPSRRRWYQMLTSAEPATPSFLQSLRASGQVNAARFLIRNQVAEKVSASLDLERGKLNISDLRGDLFGGKHHGNWQLDFTTPSPIFTGSGVFSALSLQRLAEAMNDSWISGTAAATYQISASGGDSTAFWQSANAEVQFDVKDGVLPHVSLAADEGPLHFTRWQGVARLHDAKIEIDPGKLFSSAQSYEVSGTASLTRDLDLKLTQGSDLKVGAGSLVYSVTGTVAEPRVTLIPTPETQARLKP